jgi:hypothetical protein
MIDTCSKTAGIQRYSEGFRLEALTVVLTCTGGDEVLCNTQYQVRDLFLLGIEHLGLCPQAAALLAGTRSQRWRERGGQEPLEDDYHLHVAQAVAYMGRAEPYQETVYFAQAANLHRAASVLHQWCT